MGNFLAADFCMNLGHILASGKKDLFCIAVCLLTCLPLNLYWADEQAVWFEIRYIMLKLCKSVVWDQSSVSAKASAQAKQCLLCPACQLRQLTPEKDCLGAGESCRRLLLWDSQRDYGRAKRMKSWGGFIEWCRDFRLRLVENKLFVIQWLAE